MTLWDGCGDPPGQRGVVYRWDGHGEQPSVHSLLRYVEAHSERLRGKYIAWTHDLGENRIHGRRLVDHLALDGGLSYWWMTLFVERSLWKLPAIMDAIRLLALEEILLREKPDRLSLVSANRRLHDVLVDLCERLGVAYDWDRLARRPFQQWSLRGLYRTLPQSFQGLISLARFLYARWPFKHQEKGGWFSGSQDLFVCLFLYGVDPKAAQRGRFDSTLWQVCCLS